MPRPDPSWYGRPQFVSLLDQGASGASNFFAIILVAGSMSAVEFGVFSLAFAMLLLILAVTRSWLATKVVLKSAEGPHAVSMAGSDALSVVAILAPVFAGVVGITYLLAIDTAPFGDSSPHLIGLLLCVAAPIVSAQDLLRLIASAADRPADALISDLVWLGMILIALPTIAADRPEIAVGVWLLGGMLALVFLVWRLRPELHFHGAMRTIRERSKIGEAAALGTVAVSAGIFTVSAVSIHFIGEAAAGSLRAAGTLLGPLNILLTFVDVALVGFLARKARHTDVKYCSLVTLMLIGITSLWGATLLVLPHAWGVSLLGDSWDGARAILPWTVLEYLGLAALAGAALGMKVRHAARIFLRIRLLFIGLVLVLCISAAAYFGRTSAVSAGLALSALFTAAVSWALFLRTRTADAPS